MKHIKQIIVLTPGFPGRDDEYECIPLLQNLIAALAQNFPEIIISVIALQYPFSPLPYRWKGVDVYPLNGRNCRYPRRFMIWKKAWDKINLLLCEDTVMLSFWLTETALIGSLIHKFKKVPHYAYIMGQDSKPSNKYLRLLPLSEIKIIAISSYSANEYKQTTGREVQHLITFGLDVHRYPLMMQKRDIDILGVGNLSALKNYLRFVQLIHRLISEYPELKAVIIGGGDEQKPAMEQYIHTHHLQNNIVLTGPLPRAEVLRRMQRSKIFLHTSHSESLGYVFYEALYAGMHCVTTDVGRPDVQDRLYVGNDDEALLAHLQRLMRKPLDHTPYPVPTIIESANTLVEVMQNDIS